MITVPGRRVLLGCAIEMGAVAGGPRATVAVSVAGGAGCCRFGRHGRGQRAMVAVLIARTRTRPAPARAPRAAAKRTATGSRAAGQTTNSPTRTCVYNVRLQLRSATIAPAPASNCHLSLHLIMHAPRQTPTMGRHHSKAIPMGGACEHESRR